MQKHHYQILVAGLTLTALLLFVFQKDVSYGSELAVISIALASYVSFKQKLSFKSFITNKPLIRFFGYVTLGAGTLAMFFEEELTWVTEQVAFVVIVAGVALIFSTFDSPPRDKWRL